MSGPLDEPEDATPLNPEERDGLIPSHVTLRIELNELEQQNILEADQWAFARRRDPVDEAFGRRLHRRMFGDVWRWAGSYRTSDKNLGVERMLIHPGSMMPWIKRAIGSNTRRFHPTRLPCGFITRSSSFIHFQTEMDGGHV